MAIHLTSPKEYVATDYPPGSVSLFLAGGITGCPDWQADIEARLTGIPNLVTFNPRRESFDVRNPAWSIEQIAWEHRHLRVADYTLFWFPKEGMCMITLFELGKMLGQRRKIFLGCHPEYVRAFDVQQQSRLMLPGIPIAESLDSLANLVQACIVNHDQTGSRQSAVITPESSTRSSEASNSARLGVVVARMADGVILNIEEIRQACLSAISRGTQVTFALNRGNEWPRGWPKGTLMSETLTEQKTAFNPAKVLAYIRNKGIL